MKKGKFIVLEGLDGCGKTTQLEILRDIISDAGIACCLMSNVSDSPFGKAIRKANVNSEKYLVNMKQIAAMYITELHYVTRKVKEAVDKGINVICSRHYLSTLVYAGENTTIINGINLLTDYEIMPDITFYIHVDTDTIKNRLSSRESEDHWEHVDRQREFEEKYTLRIDECVRKGYPIEVIDGNRTAEDVVTLIVDKIREHKLLNL